MDPAAEQHRAAQAAIRLTPRERMERFAELQRRAMQLLAASPDGFRHYWQRNLRQRSVDARY
ncbi:MAG: hypothetical protein K8T91_28485 [Planctomycetes bacterium]|nr:hypothetical protein [Planctomycetota bacterium]